jgi:hypothetical protein
LKRLHEEVYPRLKVASLRRVLMEKCLPESIKEKIRYKQRMSGCIYMRPDTFPHDLMLPVNTAKAVLEAHLDLLLHTFEYAKESG